MFLPSQRPPYLLLRRDTLKRSYSTQRDSEASSPREAPIERPDHPETKTENPPSEAIMSDPLPSSLDENPQFQEESGAQKFTRRLKEEPLVPLGCAATCYALYRAYRSMKAGDSVEMNRMFRARIFAQAFTLVAVVAGGMYFKTERQQRREFEKAVEERKSQEKRDAWLRELEIRDQEDRGWRERHAEMEAAANEAAKKKSAHDATRSVIESAEQKSLGILDAVMDLVSKN